MVLGSARHSGNTLGLNGACSGGSDNAAYSFNLIPQGGINGAVIYGAAAIRSTTHAPGAGYTEHIEIVQGSSSPATLAVQEKRVATAGTEVLQGTFGGSNDWAVVGIEIKPQLSMGKRSEIAADKEEVISDQSTVISYQLEQNYPNPFSSGAISPAQSGGNPSTTINFSLPEASHVKLNIYDVTGQLVKALVTGEMTAGRYSVTWNGRDHFGHLVASGTYLYQIVVESEDGEARFIKTKQMSLLK